VNTCEYPFRTVAFIFIFITNNARESYDNENNLTIAKWYSQVFTVTFIPGLKGRLYSGGLGMYSSSRDITGGAV
jgi:hypothetical protein